MPSAVIVLRLLSVTAAVSLASAQWCHWLRWECEKSAIVCRPVRYRICCAAGTAAADCNGTDADLKQAVYSSESLTYSPPFHCDMTINSSAIYCSSQHAQYTNSANESLWCAWTYWTAWTQLGGNCDSASAMRRQRSRQRACECPPPLTTSTPINNLTAACNVTVADAAAADVTMTTGTDGGLLQLSQADLDVDATTATSAPACGGTTRTPTTSDTSALWTWIVAAPLLLLLLIAVFTSTGVALGRLYTRRMRASRTQRGDEGDAKSASVSTSASVSATASEEPSGGCEQRTLSTDLIMDGSSAASAVSAVSTWDGRSGCRIFVESAMMVRLTPLYANSTQWSCPYSQLRLTPIYSHDGGGGGDSSDRYRPGSSRQPPAPEM